MLIQHYCRCLPDEISTRPVAVTVKLEAEHLFLSAVASVNAPEYGAAGSYVAPAARFEVEPPLSIGAVGAQ